MGDFFVRRPIVAMVIAIFMVIIGLVFMSGLPMEQYPDITPPIVEVRASYTGADAVSVEQSVASPLEQQINGVDNMIYMKSTNANDGTMTIQVSFDVGTDPDMNTVFTQNRVAAATAKLPEEVKRLGVSTEKSLPNILMLVSLTADDPRFDQNFLGNYALINVKDILARIKGIGRVNVIGASDYSMRIWIKPDRLAHLGIGIPEIVSAVQAQSVVVPGGKFGAEPAPPGNEFTYTVRLPERLQDEKEFGQIVVRTTADGSQVKIKDIARVELGVETYNAVTRMDGKPCAMIALYQAPGSNAVELAKTARRTMEELSRSFPKSMHYTVSLDTTQAITAGIREIVVTLIVALALVILVVYIFIQDWRAALIPTIAIPVSLIGAFIVFPMIGFTINVLSLLGLVLAIGIVVDDAIVVVEAVQVKMEEGLSPKEATRAAMKEVTAPVIATTLVMVAVFIPVAVMGGITGRLYQQFAITVAVSVVFSSINALSLSPALCGILLRRREKPMGGPLGLFFKLFNKVFDKTTRGYTGLAKIVTRRIAMGLIFMLVLTGGLLVLGKAVPGGFMPSEDMGYLMINVQLPDAASLQRSDAVVNKVEQIVRSHPEIEHVTAATGFSLLSGSMSSNAGFVFVALKDWDLREKTANEVVDALNIQFFMGVNEAQVFAFGPPAIPGLGNGSGFSLMIQDRGRQHPGLPGPEDRRLCPGGPAAAGDRLHLHHLPGRRAPTLHGHQSGQGPQGRSQPERHLHHRGCVSGRLLCQRFQPLRAALQGLHPGRARVPPQRGSHQPVLCQEPGRPIRAPEQFRDHRVPVRAGFHQPLQPLPCHRAYRRAGHGLYLGPGHGRPGRGGGRFPAHRHGLRLEQHVLPGKAGFGDRRTGVRLLSAFRVPDPGGPVRKLVPAFQHPAGHALCRVRCLDGALSGAPLQHQFRIERVRPDRPGDAHRHGRQECHFDCGVRQS